jgi:hypothetical protein
MFGASEDRARQLAYRKRRERIVSGVTCSIYRSLSSASHVSQQSHLSSTWNEESSRSPVQTEHRPSQAGTIHSENIPATQHNKRCLKFDPLLTADPPCSQMEQHRLQAEHLSQVLYSTLSLATPAPKSSSALSLSSFLSVQGIPGRHIRNITAPVALADLSALFASTPPGRQDLPTLPFIHRTLCDGQLHQQSMVSLRGGGDPHDLFRSTSQSHPNNSGQAPGIQLQTQMTKAQMQASAQAYQSQAHAEAQAQKARIQAFFSQYHTYERQYLTLFPWAREHHLVPAFLVPISCGSYLNSFLGLLPLNDANYFLNFFGPQQLPTSYTSPVANARRQFYLNLDEHVKSTFQDVIFARATELIAVRDGQPDPQLSLQARPDHRVMLFHLMEAMESVFVPSPEFLQTGADCYAYMTALQSLDNNVATRSSSAPSLGHQSEPTG